MEGSRKTLARSCWIALEEVKDECTVSYGIRTRKLCGVAFVQECKAILKSIGGVVRDLKDRMAVEIGREAYFVAYDLDAWRTRSPGPEAGPSMPRCSMLATVSASVTVGEVLVLGLSMPAIQRRGLL